MRDAGFDLQGFGRKVKSIGFMFQVVKFRVV